MDDEFGSKLMVNLSPAARAQLGRHLLTMYGDVVNQGVPTEILRGLGWSEGQGRDLMLAAVPSLRAFAISLSGNVDRAHALVRETMLRAWTNLDSFKAGDNMSAWLFTILRDLFRSEYRKRRRDVEDVNGCYAEEDFRRALKRLPTDQRESLILVGASGFSYEEAAQICGCAVGTIKSRVNRGRLRLATILSIESAKDFGPAPENVRGAPLVVRDGGRRQDSPLPQREKT